MMREPVSSEGQKHSTVSDTKKRHNFYTQALDEAEQLELAEAAEVEGLDGEIAILRLKLRELVEQHPEQIELQLKAANTIARLCRTRYNITTEQKKSLKEAITNVLTEVAIPLGIKFIPGSS